jgi:hypothetical protein
MSSLAFLQNLEWKSSMANGVDCHVENSGWSRRCRWVRSWRSRVVAPAESPATEQEEEADQGGPDHRAGGGEDPIVEWNFLGQLLGFLGHGLQLVE